MAVNTSPQFVFKVSKYCNLRCDYCYEFPHLGDMSRMRVDQIRAAFQNIKGSTVEDFRDPSVEAILYPPQFKSGDVIYPYEKAKK